MLSFQLKIQSRMQWIFFRGLTCLTVGLIGSTSLAALPMGLSKKPKRILPRYNVSMRIGLKNSTPFSVNMIGKTGKKSSFTEISSDGLTETFVEVIPRKSMLNQKEGILFDVIVRKTVRGNIKDNEKTQIFAYENQESEIRVNARGKGREDLAIAVLANPIVATN